MAFVFFVLIGVAVVIYNCVKEHFPEILATLIFVALIWLTIKFVRWKIQSRKAAALSGGARMATPPPLPPPLSKKSSPGSRSAGSSIAMTNFADEDSLGRYGTSPSSAEIGASDVRITPLFDPPRSRVVNRRTAPKPIGASNP